MQDKENGHPEMVVVRFDKWIRIGRYKKKVIAAEYTEEDWFGKILLISNNDLVIPKENELCLVFLPKKHSYPKTYHNEIGVFRVRIIMPEIIGKIKVFKNIFIPGPLLKEYNGNNNNRAAAILMNPDEKHETFLIRIIRNHNNSAGIERFVRKNFAEEEVKIKNGTIEIITDCLQEGFWNNLSDSILNLSED